MNRRYLVIATTLVALLFASATAQEDNLLQRYDLAIENLEIAVASVPSDGLQARDELERALNALLTLSTNASSSTLVQAMERTFDRTRVAIENQSRTDMAVQTSVLAGGFGRLVMDSAFAAAANGDTATARARLTHLAGSVGFDEANLQALQDAASASAMRLAFEAGAADAISVKVQDAAAMVATDQGAAYELLAAAYGQSLLVQDSPRVGTELNRSLVNAANALVAANADDATAALETASTQLANLASAARGQAPEAETQPTQQADPEATPAELPSTEPDGQPATAQPQEVPEEVPSEEAPAAQVEPATQEPDITETGLLPLLSTPDFETAVQLRLEEIEAERRAATVADIARGLTRAGVPAALAADQAENLATLGYTSVEDAISELEAQSARIVALQRSGDVEGARAGVSRLRTTYQQAAAPALRSSDVELSTSTEQLLGSLLDRFTLTSHDVSLLAAQTGAIRASLTNGPAPTGHQLEMTVDSYWAGYTRTIVLIVLAILAIVPLALLNLAFGGSNRNWRLVGWALFLLLITVFYEGIAALAGLIGHYANMPFLTSLATWSVFSSTVALAVWAVLVLIALLLAIVGLYGICVQFGLLGGSRKTKTTTTTAIKQEKKPTGSTTIDWDEEF